MATDQTDLDEDILREARPKVYDGTVPSGVLDYDRDIILRFPSDKGGIWFQKWWEDRGASDFQDRCLEYYAGSE
jgi:hypothetical protein